MSYEQILKEEIAKQSKQFDLNPDELKGFLNELFTFDQSKLLKNMGNQEEILDSKDSLPEEFWEEIISNINESYQESSKQWDEELRKIKYQILCFKYFTKKELPELSEIEKNLKVEIKRFFSSLQNYASLDDFKDRFFNLPAELLLNFVRYILNKSPELNKKLVITKSSLKDKVDELMKERKKIIKKISFISNKNISTLDLKNIKDLVDNGLFYEDNLLNRGVNEYLFKLINHNEASKNILETFNSTFVKDLQQSIENSNSYLSHISAIRNEESAEYFSPTGLQVGRRFDNEIEAIEKNDLDDAVIDKDSIFKEPKGRINDTGFAFDDANAGATDGEGDEGSGDSAGGGGGFSGGGGGSYSGATGGEETVNLDSPDAMPAGEDGLPEDFGTEDSNDAGGDAPIADSGEDISEEKPEEKGG